MITLSSPSIVPQILDNLIQIAKSVTTLNEVNQLDRALSALETRFDIPEEQLRPVSRAFSDAQSRVCPPPRPVIDDTTKFVILHRSGGMWNLYSGPRSWAETVTIHKSAVTDNAHNGHEYRIALFCDLPTKS